MKPIKIYLTKGKKFFGKMRYKLVYNEQLWFERLSGNYTFTKKRLDFYANGISESLNDFEYVYTDVPYNSELKDGLLERFVNGEAVNTEKGGM